MSFGGDQDDPAACAEAGVRLLEFGALHLVIESTDSDRRSPRNHHVSLELRVHDRLTGTRIV
jgi:hypothetical protein